MTTLPSILLYLKRCYLAISRICLGLTLENYYSCYVVGVYAYCKKRDTNVRVHRLNMILGAEN